MNEKSTRYSEYFRTAEYNEVREFNDKRAIKSVGDSVTSLTFDESTHRKNSYASSSSSAASRREKQKNSNKIAVLATAGAFSVVTMVAVVLAAIVGIAFLSYSSDAASISCVVDIPQDLDGVFKGVLYDVNGAEITSCEVSGNGEQTFFFNGLSPSTDYYFSIFDENGQQYLYETVRTADTETPAITLKQTEYYPHAAVIGLELYNPSDATFTVTVRYDDDKTTDESFPLDGSLTVTARSANASTARIFIDGNDGVRYFDLTCPLYSVECFLTSSPYFTEDGAFVLNLSLDNPCGCAIYVAAVDEKTGLVVAQAEAVQGENEIILEGLTPGESYYPVLLDPLGERYALSSGTR